MKKEGDWNDRLIGIAYKKVIANEKTHMKINDQEVRNGIEKWLKVRLSYESHDDGDVNYTSYWGFLQKIMTAPNCNEIIKKLKIERDQSKEVKASEYLERYFYLEFGNIYIPRKDNYPNIELEYNQMFSAGFTLICLSYLLDKDEERMNSTLKSAKPKNSGCMVTLSGLLIMIIFSIIFF
jgi:hypothetical protein